MCSVSVSENNDILSFKELNNGYTHAENLHLFIQETLKDASIKPNQLKAISVSKGPGSYTGLRIGVSAAKGLAYSLKIPLISLETLQIMAQAAIQNENETAVYCPMIDARRMEVYTGVYNQHLHPISEINALIVNKESIFEKYTSFNKIFFFGDGMLKCKTLLEELPQAEFIEGIWPSAKHMASLSFKKFNLNQFENVAYFEPYYLKEFISTAKKN